MFTSTLVVFFPSVQNIALGKGRMACYMKENARSRDERIKRWGPRKISYQTGSFAIRLLLLKIWCHCAMKMQCPFVTDTLSSAVPRLVSLVPEGQLNEHMNTTIQSDSASFTMSMVHVTYKVPLVARLTHTAHVVAQFFGMMAQFHRNPANDAEFLILKNRQCDLEGYRDALRVLYTDPDTKGLGFGRWKASEIRTYKDDRTKYLHEYLVATLHDENNDKMLLRIERRCYKCPTSKGSTKVPRRHKNILSTPDAIDQNDLHSIPPSKTDKFSKTACDGVTVITPDEFVDQKQLSVDRFTFSEDGHVPLAQLVLLACAIKEHSSTYDPVKYNCYWFCNVASAALRKRFSVQDTNPAPAKRKQGQFYGIPLGQTGPDDTDAVLNRYDEIWEKFEKKIRETNGKEEELQRETNRANKSEELVRKLQQELAAFAECPSRNQLIP
ncbi:hypothetical protein APHAL10511_001475 [Amanita phalloides]|nr:hypothetical protein APHAL10511_001475 [Amanita phalloides]